MAMTLVSTVTVGAGGAASIEFTNIPQTGKDLLLVLSGRGNAAANTSFVGYQLNSTSSSGGIKLEGTGSTASSSISPNIRVPAANSTANTFGNLAIYVSNYTSSVNKSVSVDMVTENNAAEAFQHLNAVSYAVTAVTSVTLSLTNFVQYSTASLYIIS